MAFGKLGMGVDEFYDMLPREFWNKVDGFYEMENYRQRAEWERCRWSTCLLINIHVEKGKKIKPNELIEFDWDKKITTEDAEALKDRAEYIRKVEELEQKRKNNGK